MNVGQGITVELSSEADPVCGMHLGKTANVQNILERDGKIIGFCSNLCKKQFLTKKIIIF